MSEESNRPNEDDAEQGVLGSPPPSVPGTPTPIPASRPGAVRVSEPAPSSAKGTGESSSVTPRFPVDLPEPSEPTELSAPTEPLAMASTQSAASTDSKAKQRTAVRASRPGAVSVSSPASDAVSVKGDGVSSRSVASSILIDDLAQPSEPTEPPVMKSTHSTASTDSKAKQRTTVRASRPGAVSVSSPASDAGSVKGDEVSSRSVASSIMIDDLPAPSEPTEPSELTEPPVMRSTHSIASTDSKAKQRTAVRASRPGAVSVSSPASDAGSVKGDGVSSRSVASSIMTDDLHAPSEPTEPPMMASSQSVASTDSKAKQRTAARASRPGAVSVSSSASETGYAKGGVSSRKAVASTIPMDVPEPSEPTEPSTPVGAIAATGAGRGAVKAGMSMKSMDSNISSRTDVEVPEPSEPTEPVSESGADLLSSSKVTSFRSAASSGGASDIELPPSSEPTEMGEDRTHAAASVSTISDLKARARGSQTPASQPGVMNISDGNDPGITKGELVAGSLPAPEEPGIVYEVDEMGEAGLETLHEEQEFLPSKQDGADGTDDVLSKKKMVVLAPAVTVGAAQATAEEDASSLAKKGISPQGRGSSRRRRREAEKASSMSASDTATMGVLSRFLSSRKADSKTEDAERGSTGPFDPEGQATDEKNEGQASDEKNEGQGAVSVAGMGGSNGASGAIDPALFAPMPTAVVFRGSNRGTQVDYDDGAPRRSTRRLFRKGSSESQQDSRPWYAQMKVCICGIVLVVILAGVVIGTAIAFSRKEDVNVASEEDLSFCYLAESGSSFSSRYQEVRSKIDEFYGDLSAEDVPESPQRKATCWLADGDPAQVVVYDVLSKWIQRYVVALLFFSLAPGENSVDVFKEQGWLSGGGECTWGGIACVDGDVKELNLRDSKLEGTVPMEIGDLSLLTKIDFHNNGLRGPLPDDFFSLVELVYLSFYRNPIKEFTSSYSSLKKLEFLDLSDADIESEIPTQIGLLTQLQHLDLQLNDLVSSLPQEISALTALTALDLSSNKLSGLLPQDFGNLSNLRLLRISKNDFEGPLPDDIWGMTLLEILIFRENFGFGGILPASIGQLTKLRKLEIDSVDLSGTIPTEIGNAISLEILWMNDNRLDGTLPTELGNLINMKELYLNQNDFSETIPTELENLVHLSILYLQNNNLRGTVPPDVCSADGSEVEVGVDCPGWVKECECCFCAKDLRL